MKRCPTCHRSAAASRERCAIDGQWLHSTGLHIDVRNPAEPPPGLGETTTIGPPPLPPPGTLGAPADGPASAAGSANDDAAGEAQRAATSATVAEEPGAKRAQTLIYARGELADALPEAAEPVEPEAIPTDLPDAPLQRPHASATGPGTTLTPGQATAVARQPAAPAIPVAPVTPAADVGMPPALPRGGGPTPARTTSPRPATGEAPERTTGPRPLPGDRSAVPAAERPTLVTSLDGVADLDESEGERSAYVGKLIDDRYLVKALIGRGGMGAVYRVEQIHLRKDMAIKLLHENLVARKQLVSRFTREARAISRLSSAHTVMVYDFGRWGEVFYLVMELLEGEPLDAVLERDAPLNAERAITILLQMCDSLQEAHDHGIVHRDLKPENVMLLRDGPHPDFVKILDFGLAKVENVDDPYTIHSQKDIFGTPFYMSPEQIRAGDVDGRSDIYAVGALAFRMLTGKHVFGHERSTFDILKAHLMEAPPKMQSVVPAGTIISPAMEQVVARCLEKDPAQRFASMRDFGEGLVAARKGTMPAKAQPSEKADQAASGAQPAPVIASSPYSDAASPDTAVKLAEDDETLGRHVRRGRTARTAAFVAASACALGLAGWLALQVGGSAVGADQEPNDLPSQAAPLDSQGKATGSIGRRHSERAGDRDCYRLPAGSEDELDLSVTAVPNMDLELTLHGEGGSELMRLDHAGAGEGEVVRHIDAGGRPMVVCIGERVAAGRSASESVSDVYVLQALRRARSGPTEREPNDTIDKDPLPAGLSLIGTLDGPRDVDVFPIKDKLEGQIVRVHVESLDQRPLGGMRVALHDANGRPMASEVVRPAQSQADLALAVSGHAPERVSLRWIGDSAERWPPNGARTGAYKIWYRVDPLADQPEREPNNTSPNASALVVGAWHVGDVNDAAGVDWWRIDGGDETLRTLYIEAGVPPGSSVQLVVHDPQTQAGIRQLVIDDPHDDTELSVDGRGAGFLFRFERAQPQVGKRKTVDGRYRLRVRWATSGEELPRWNSP